LLTQTGVAVGTVGDLPAQTWLELYHQLNGDYDQAVQLSNDLISRFPLYWPGHLNLGEVLREQGDINGAIQQQERVPEQDPRNASGIAYLARAYLDSRNLGKARETLERAAAEDRRNLSAAARIGHAPCFGGQERRGPA
jgi:tetratricopeptide (TPR) repeat protein